MAFRLGRSGSSNWGDGLGSIQWEVDQAPAEVDLASGWQDLGEVRHRRGEVRRRRAEGAGWEAEREPSVGGSRYIS